MLTRRGGHCMNRTSNMTLIVVIVLSMMIIAPVWAQTAGGEGDAKSTVKEGKPAMGESAGDLAKAAQNPVADMVSIPIQPNFNFDYGADRDKTQIVTNIQPVIPISLTKDLNLITRTIIPFIYTEYPAYQTGLGNIQFTGFFSPAKPGKFIWGFGPVV